jgi:hypothetical protein
MPTKRRRIAHASAIGPVEIEHLRLGPTAGGHLLAGRCTLCRSPESFVRAAWQAQRSVLMAGWRHPFALWAQVKFDGVPLGPRGEPLSVYHMIADSLD